MKDKQLLFTLTKKDFRIEFMRGSGKGGQNRNKRDTACRITHIESGASAYCCDERSQLRNKMSAFHNVVTKDKFKNWYKIECAKLNGLIPTKEDIEKEVEKKLASDLIDGNIKIEYFTPEESK